VETLTNWPSALQVFSRSLVDDHKIN